MNYHFNGVSLQNKRKTNMDSLLLKSEIVDERKAVLAVVCDGVGSLADGAFASGKTVQMLSEWFGKLTTAARVGLVMRDAILSINARIVSESRQQKLKTASTLSALLLIGCDYYIAHIGDSRIYSFQQDSLSVLTNDDVSESGMLTGCIGRSEKIFLQYSEGSAAGKIFLICSDGLYKRMDMDFLKTKLNAWNKKSLIDFMEDLPKYVIERGEQDNITLAIVKTEG